jgi:hypothetical protein
MHKANYFKDSFFFLQIYCFLPFLQIALSVFGYDGMIVSFLAMRSINHDLQLVFVDPFPENAVSVKKHSLLFYYTVILRSKFLTAQL